MRVKFVTLGCKVNQYETEAMQRLFELAGHSAVEDVESADVVVINTCAVTAVAAQKSRQMIHRAARSGAVIAVVGCYAQERPTEIEADVVIGTRDRIRIVELVERVFNSKKLFFPPTRPLFPAGTEQIPTHPLKPSALQSKNGNATQSSPDAAPPAPSTTTPDGGDKNGETGGVTNNFIPPTHPIKTAPFKTANADISPINADAAAASTVNTETLTAAAAETFNIVGEVDTNFEELPHNPARTRAFIKIEDGCDNRCSYCIIPTLRGTVRSRPLDSIRAECNQLHSLGFKEIVLTGIHLGAYGKDIKLNLLDAIKVALDAGKPRRLRLSSIEATEVHDDLITLIKNDPRLCHHLHLPLQSGCDEILRAMHRPYTTKQFATLVERLATEIPNIAITTDLIVGFPGETEELFRQSIRFVKSMPFTKLHVFPYSIRRGTVAAKMPNQIPSAIKKERAAQMIDISNQKSVAYRKQFVGATVDVLTETFTNGVTDGLTDNYIRVFIAGNAPLNEIVRVKITGLNGDGVDGIDIAGGEC